MQPLDKQAIHAALSGNWPEAISINSQLVEKNPLDVDAYNRLAFAQAQLNDISSACKTYQKILSIDPENPIALKNLARFKEIHNCIKHENGYGTPVNPEEFISDTHKIRLVTLVHPAPPSVLAAVCPGQKLVSHRKGYEIQIQDENNVYVGSLPDDIGRLIIKNQETLYEYFVKEVQDKTVIIVLKQHQRDK
jgi:tetratricopeptide (TPR) repeat protein